jgi:hypothetical protein
MAIARWHYGKIALLWGWGAVLMWAVFESIQALSHPVSPTQLIFGYLLLAVLAVIPLLLSIVTWKWLTGKEVKASVPLKDEGKSG